MRKGPKEIFYVDGKKKKINHHIYNLCEITLIFIQCKFQTGSCYVAQCIYNLPDDVKLCFRKLYDTMLSQHCMDTHFPNSHPQFVGNIWYLSTFLLNFVSWLGET